MTTEPQPADLLALIPEVPPIVKNGDELDSVRRIGFKEACEEMRRNIESLAAHRGEVDAEVACNVFGEPFVKWSDGSKTGEHIGAKLCLIPPQAQAGAGDATLAWAVERWHAEVANRPLQNVHRRSLDDVWRQVIRHCGADDVSLCGPRHDQLRAALEASHASE